MVRKSRTSFRSGCTIGLGQSNGRRTETYFADGSTRTNVYDSVGRVTAVKDGLSTNYMVYTCQGLLSLRTNIYGQVLRLDYDIDDRLISRVDQNGVTMTNSCDLLGRLWARSRPAISSTEQFL